MKRISLIVALVLSTWSFASTVHAVGYISYVGLLTTNEDKNSDTSNKINATSGDTVDFVISAQDAQGNSGTISSDPTINTIGTLLGQELKLTKNVSGSWPESENILHHRITIPSVYSNYTICSDIVLKLETTILTAHNQYTSITKERTILACSRLPVIRECSDGIDNDHDGAIDYPNDFSCLGSDDATENTPPSQCQDGIDNDNDGLTDLHDSGCLSSQDNDETEIVATPTPTAIPPTPIPFPATVCSDGIDNDGDDAIDYPNDFGCLSANSASEDSRKSQCQDGIDNDGDGLVDLQDTGCFSSQDNDETEIVATPTPTAIPPTPPYSPSPSVNPSPAIGVVSPSPSAGSIQVAIDKKINEAILSQGMITEIDKAISSATGQQSSIPITATATAVATTAATVSVVNIVQSVASASTQTFSSFGNFFFGVYFRKKRKSEHWVKVVDSITGKGVGGSMIQVRTIDGKVRAIWRTDDKTGNTGDLLPPGEYEFIVSKAGWRFPSYIQPIFTKQKGDIVYRRGVIEVDQNKEINIKGDKNE